ncbi:MAG: cbb3-type cytochrome c oxidase subunit I, partial [Solirubrobacteraceae bacterium]
VKLNEKLAKIHFWSLWIAFNSTFGPLFALGLLGMPRRVVNYPTTLQALNVWVSISAYVILASMSVFILNLIYSFAIKREPAERNPWNSKSIEFQYETPLPVYDYERLPVFDEDPYPYGVDEESASRPVLTPAGGEV